MYFWVITLLKTMDYDRFVMKTSALSAMYKMNVPS